MKIVVAPLAGARIEIYMLWIMGVRDASLPSRERGLKFCESILMEVCYGVAPLAGARIEIHDHPADL